MPPAWPLQCLLLFLGLAASSAASFLKASPATVAPVTLTWSFSSSQGTDDWVSLYAPGTTSPSSSTFIAGWQYTYGGETKEGIASAASGSVSLVAPSTPGTYPVFYCANNGYTCPASTTVTVAVSAPPLTASPASVAPGSSVTVSWKLASSSQGTNDWISFYAPGTTSPSSTTFLSGWQYTYGGETKTGAAAAATGSVTLTAPSTAGAYPVFYCTNAAYTCVASTTVTVSAPGPACSTLTLSAPASVAQSGLVNVSWSCGTTTSVNDWILFVPAGKTPSSSTYDSQAWRYTYGGQSILNSATSSTVSGTIAITAPATTGSYVVWYCLNNGYTCPASFAIAVKAAQVPPVTCSAAGVSSIKHLVLIETENHSFDSMFGSYCKAAAGSNPAGNYGPTACEAPPATVSGYGPTVNTDAQNIAFSPDHSSSGETCEINGGKMDRFVTGCTGSSSASNFAIYDTSATGAAALYGKIASSTAFANLNSAMADRFFQSAIGASSENDMYFTIPHYMFQDNSLVPQNCSFNGMRCYCGSTFASYYAPTVYDLLSACGVSWTMYADGYAQNPQASECYGSYYDASDFGEAYFPRLTQNPSVNWRDSAQMAGDVASGKLPSVSHVRARGDASEHPGYSISASTSFIQSIVSLINNSPTYRQNTLVLIAPDESGGYYDHVPLPSTPSAIDGVFQGPRTGFMALGSMVKAPSKAGGYVSHQTMEPSSIIKFIEWNWLNQTTGQLKGRDQVVSNLGSLLNSTKTGVMVPVF